MRCLHSKNRQDDAIELGLGDGVFFFAGCDLYWKEDGRYR